MTVAASSPRSCHLQGCRLSQCRPGDSDFIPHSHADQEPQVSTGRTQVNTQPWATPVAGAGLPRWGEGRGRDPERRRPSLAPQRLTVYQVVGEGRQTSFTRFQGRCPQLLHREGEEDEEREDLQDNPECVPWTRLEHRSLSTRCRADGNIAINCDKRERDSQYQGQRAVL